LNNVSVLLEVAQNTFDRSRQVLEKYRNSVVDMVLDNTAGLLAQPINRESLAAYTKYKFPTLPINQRIQELLIRDLDHDSYRTLADIDNALDRAAPAVCLYAKQRPEFFKAGTDYLTKSLGFVDVKFRAKHGFAKVSRDAFSAFSTFVEK
jgi:hypothetical protein